MIDIARQIWERVPYPATDADKVERAQEIVDQAGDLPEVVFYEMIMGAEHPEALSTALAALRPAGSPRYVGGWV